MTSLPPVRGRGAAVNPKNRFESIERVPEPPQDSDDISSPQTQFFVDSSKSIIAYNDSPDVGFDDQRQSVPGMRAWLRLLLRSAVA